MKYPLSHKDKLFLWKCARMYQYWNFRGDLAYKRGKVNLANKRWLKGQFWWELGWERSIGM